MKKIVMLGLIVNLPAYLSQGADAWKQYAGIFLSLFLLSYFILL